jgi:glyoxylase-like metal-dependent hydrolase (beta-lactamase superfamily II)/rhodanese-related sulfurtransferase
VLLFQQYYLQCLSHASYLVGDTDSGRAVVIDPQRDVHQYIEDAAANGLRIERVIETHFHADFLSGHLELAARTGAVISYGEAARPEYDIAPLADGQRLSLGDVTLEARATPGHTPESISVVVFEHADDEVPYGVCTGDTLFIGDVGRPDLLSSAGVSADELAAQLYRSLHQQLLTLPDSTRVFPAHGAGSACGKSLSTETSSTIGEQRRTNYALAPMSEEEFVHAVTEGQSITPLYFAFSAGRNKQRHDLLGEESAPAALSLDDVLQLQQDGATVLDTRDPADFAQGHLRGSVNVGLHGRFAEYAGDVIAPDAAIVLVGLPGTGLEAKVRLARIGFDRVVGELADPVHAFLARPELVDAASRLTVQQFATRREEVDVTLLDVRNPGETRLGLITGARSVPLATLLENTGTLPRVTPVVVYCAGGYRSSIAASVLRAQGFADVSDLLGGFDAWSQAGYPIGKGGGPA